ncbi:MAG: efflux RND transporter permease subunit [Planctomycetes bacterium]|nr:efflux RND transporter permease subunit [Planctomycetota bacterium]
MKLIDVCVEKPVRVWVFVILAALFGAVAVLTMPMQLAPTTDRPEITVQTTYRGAAPLEVEQQLTDALEEKLTSVEGVDEMTSTSREGSSSVVLTFDWSTNKDIARLDVSEKLGLVENVPEDADRSVVRAVNSDEENPIAWIVLDAPEEQVVELSDEMDDVVRTRLERVPGVGGSRFLGGRKREVHVVLDTTALAGRGISVAQVRDAILRENRNDRGGTSEAGKRRWVVRTVGQYDTLRQLEQTIVATGADGTPVVLRDVAEVRFGREKRDAIVRQNGRPTIVMGMLRRTGANVMDVMRDLKQEIAAINATVFAGRGVRLVQVYDETEYIEEAKDLVVDNLVTGSILATLILILFLKSITSTLVVGLSIPISLITTFIVMQLLGRTLNIVSLAGLAFASGMVVDNAIVVVENVYRHARELGKPLRMAARDATVEVWGALVASTLTTLAVFLPIVFVKEEAGQLFRDIAIAISASVGLSLVVAITVVPMLCARLLRPHGEGVVGHLLEKLLKPFDLVGAAFVGGTTAMVRWLERGVVRRFAYLALVVGGSVWAFLAFLPPIDYLPKGNRNLVLCLGQFPAGYSLEEQDRTVRAVEQRALANPQVDRIFSIVGLEITLVGVLAKKEQSTIPEMQKLVGAMWGATSGVPGGRFFVTQTPIFRSRGGFLGGTQVEVAVRGPDLQALAETAARVQQLAAGVPGFQFARSSFDYGNPELQVVVDRHRATELGLRSQDVGVAVATVVDGVFSGIFRENGKERDIRLLGDAGDRPSPDDLSRTRLALPRGGSISLDQVADVRRAEGPTKIERRDRERAITLTLGFAANVPLETAIAGVESTVLTALRPTLPRGYTIAATGQAKDLDRTWKALSGSFLLGLLVIYLLMAALFDSFALPFVIMLTVPFAMTGGVLAAAWAHATQPLVMMDVITMIGFVILAGTVVNNSILIVHQALNFQRENGLPLSEALAESVRTRIRPIFMTVITTVLGMLPLALSEGSGSELYRGLGAVVTGGLVLSTLFTLTVTPAFMSLVTDAKDGLVRLGRFVLRRSPAAPAASPGPSGPEADAPGS